MINFNPNYSGIMKGNIESGLKVEIVETEVELILVTKKPS